MRAFAWVVIATLMIVSNAVVAQEKHAIDIAGDGVSGKYLKQYTIDVDDVAGHQLRVYEMDRRYTGASIVTIEGEKVVGAHGSGQTDYVNGVGTAASYWTWLTDKGNKILVVAIGTSSTKPTESGWRRGVYNGTARIVGGTGPFARIRGALVESAKFDTDPKDGYSIVETHGEYWMDK